MVPPLDIFKIDPRGGVLWCNAAATLETAKAHIQKLAVSSPGNHLILNQKTGQRVSVMPSGTSAQIEHLSVESRNGPRIGMG
jgi:hypothetical protein